MRAALAELNEELERRCGVTLQTRTGVNTGEVIAGDPARGGGFVSGDAVNVAARLEQAAPPDEILIGERTLELVRDAVTGRAGRRRWSSRERASPCRPSGCSRSTRRSAGPARGA